MTLINNAVLAYLRPILREFERSRTNPLLPQEKEFASLMKNGSDTLFGKEHGLSPASSYEEFSKKVPVRDYNMFSPYIERVRRGEDYILWNEKIRWFAKSSGTSSDRSKYIPISPSNLDGCHYKGFKTLLASYISNNPSSRIFLGKALTLGGSVTMDELGSGSTLSGDLSAILLKNSPKVAEMVRTPSKRDAMEADFDKKTEIICKVCSKQDITNFSGVPSWNLVMLRKILEYNNARYLTDVWPRIELFMHGGISFEPYRDQYRELIPTDQMHYVENYNASEGYFALQDDPSERGMMLTLRNGVFYEFIPMDKVEDYLNGCERRALTVADVEKEKDYAMVITTNSGLWRYLIGDCVRFTSLYPHRIIISGRTQLFINAFGEELMIHNAEEAVSAVSSSMHLSVTDYTVAPRFMSGDNGKGAHEWCMEFSPESTQRMKDPEIRERFVTELDNALRRGNSDYDAKRCNDTTMQRLVLHLLPPGTFYRWMESRKKIGGQNKVPRLSGSRKFVEELLGSLD